MRIRTISGMLLLSTAPGLTAVAAVAREGRAGSIEAAALLDPGYVARSACGPAAQRRHELFRPGVRVAAAQATGAAQATAAPPLWDNLGSLTFAVTTRDDRAQRYFDQGLRLAFAFNHAEAARAFRAAQRIDPGCAMCYWGEALVLGPNINAPMEPAAVEPAFAAAAKAMALTTGATAMEQALIAAVAKRYAPDPAADRAALDRTYADAMAEVAARFADNDTIQALFAEAVMDVSPWDYWEADGVTAKGRMGEAVAALERVLARSPDHPGAIHLYIHAVEASTTPERAEPHADRLGALVPGAGHLVHMPSHIYYRVGRYLDSLAANRAAVAADEVYLAQVEADGIYPYGYYPHNVHFLLASAQMSGDAASAIEAAEKLDKVMSDEVARAAPWVQAIKTAPYTAHAQLSEPAMVLALPDPGDEFPFVRATWHYARGVALARRNRPDGAMAELEAIRRIKAEADFTGLTQGGVPAPDVLDIADAVLRGRMAQALGDRADAVAAFREAVALQDALPYMEPPYWYYPVRQSLGAALLMAGDAAAAEQVFRESLVRAPNNAWALWGLMQAQKALGDAAGAAATAALFERAWAGGAVMPDLATL
jgi:tetratricopeptide (TPR) repeat protein